jgi:hypothetical protein
MLVADLLLNVQPFGAFKTNQRIWAKDVYWIQLRNFIPKLLEPQRRFRIALGT